jgi:hypothetical protein
VDALRGDSATANLALAEALPKIWIGYALCVATFIADVIFVANHPEITTVKFFIPPLPLFLLGFISSVYWLVCVHKLHVVLAHVPHWKHPISPARAVWFHFIPFYNLYWLYKWPAETARFVNWAFGMPVVRPRGVGAFGVASYILAILLGPGGLIMLFFSLSHMNNWVRKALLAPLRPPPGDDGSSNPTAFTGETS